ncbi:blastoderm-specific protein 25D [Homalodisca vitripennis]|uniref:blastoderm-specific protein 25D n=1 Tax=Homalodisca vitripennis TaxID=197043 RepID=UPI001EEB8ED9|nr:blastoderm-specific protein 25D [Homalodisca vitripennis]
MTDPYEQQLLAVFESCDVEGTGRLDCKGLTQLCDQLHLEDGRRQLMDCLLPAFTFDQFRDALLALLGATRRNRDPSPEREVSPKFVFGQKKYGRRSRPESTDQAEDDDDVEDYDVDNGEDCDIFLPLNQNENIKTKNKPSHILIDDCKIDRDTVITPTSIHSVIIDKEEMESPRGQGEAELRSAWRRLGVGTDGFLDPTELAMVCRAVGMEKMADEVVKQVFAKLEVDAEGRISFEEFLQLFRGSHNPPVSSHPHNSPSFQQQHLTSLDITSSGYVSSDVLADLWDAGGVVNASGLLADLGVSHSGEVSLSSLAALLDEEVRSMASKSNNPSPQVNALTAALVLAQGHLKWTRTCLEQMTGERDKLHSDLAEANQRATLLAHEVDDRHARMERASQMQIKLLEQRHAEQVKQLSVQLAMDRDQLTAATLRLEKKLALQQEEEAKLRADLNNLQVECDTMEKENQSMSEQLAECEGIKVRAEIDSLQIQQLQQRVQELESSSEQVQSLVEQLAILKAENTSLRDRNDELTMQVENLTARPVIKRQNSSEGGLGSGTKRRGNSPLALPPEHSWDEESPRLGKVRRYCTDTDLSLDSVPIEGLAIGRSLRHSESGLEADLDTLDNSLTLSSPSVDKVTFNIGGCEEAYIAEIAKLQASIAELQQSNEEYKKRLAELSAGPTSCSDIMKSTDVASVQGSPVKAAEEEEASSTLSTLATESTEVQTSLDNVTEVNRLEKHCYELRHTLDNVQGEIVKILSEKKACNEENCVLKQRIEELRRSLPKTVNNDVECQENTSGPLTYTLSDVSSVLPDIGALDSIYCDKLKDSPKNIALKCFPFMNRKESNPDAVYCLFPTKDRKDNGGFKFENLSQFAFELSQSLSDTNCLDHPFSDFDSKPLSPCLSDNGNSDNLKSVNSSCKQGTGELKTDESIVVISRKEPSTTPTDSELVRLTQECVEWKEKCAELETSLEMMRVEYEKCEDYWQGKLNEERAIFDQEQRLSDEKFAELEAKIQEYSELFSMDDKRGTCRLPTIDERDSLEKQVTDLEEEFESFKLAALSESQIKTEQIEKLQNELHELRKKQADMVRDTHDVEVQASEQTCEFRLHEPCSSPPRSKAFSKLWKLAGWFCSGCFP